MALDRARVGDIPEPPVLRPQADPVDIYVAPPRQPPSQNSALSQFAASLQSVNPELQQFIGTQEERVTQDDYKKGMELRSKNQADFKTAIKQGIIQPGQSPWFRKGYQRMDAQMQGQNYQSALAQGYNQSGLANQDDPQKVGDFIANFNKTWTQASGVDQNPEAKNVLPGVFEDSRARIMNLHSQQRIDAYTEHSKDTLYNLSYGLSPGNDVPTALALGPEQVGARLTQSADDMIAHGMNPTEANRTITDAINQRARDEGNPDILDSLDHVRTGSGNIGGTAYARQEQAETLKHIFARQRQMEELANTKLAAQKKAASDKGYADAFQAIQKDPINADLTPIQEQMIANGDSEGAKGLYGLKTAALNNRQNDPQVFSGYLSDIYNGIDESTMHRNMAYSMKMGQLTQDAQYHLQEEYDRFQKSKEIRGDQTLNDQGTALEKSITGDADNFKQNKAVVGSQAKTSYWQAQSSYYLSGPGGKRPQMEMWEHGSKVQAFLSKHYTDNVDAPIPSGADTTKAVDGAPTPAAPAPRAEAPKASEAEQQLGTVDEAKQIGKAYDAGDEEAVAKVHALAVAAGLSDDEYMLQQFNSYKSKKASK